MSKLGVRAGLRGGRAWLWRGVALGGLATLAACGGGGGGGVNSTPTPGNETPAPTATPTPTPTPTPTAPCGR